jgi:pSer/pThr/pTyr-binding forkhead associated (FHA) protein
MILKIIVTKKSDSKYFQQLEFDRFPILLGRGEKNDITLPDSIKIISREHAKIVDTEGILKLVDLESANFTYLNDQRIEPNEENALQAGNKIKIGEYELEVELVMQRDTKTFDDQRTMVFSSPFAKDVKNLSENLKSLSEKYSLDESPKKGEMLRFSILQSLNTLKNDEMTRILSEYFAEKFLDKENYPDNTNNQKLVTPDDLSSQIEPIKSADEKNILMESDKESASRDYSFDSHFSNTIDIMLETLIKLIQGFLQYRQEFFGVTIYHTIPTGSLKEIKEYLFDPNISSEEQKKRTNQIKEETEKLLAHQIGLLEGYRISVKEGCQALLQSLDPDLIEQQVESKKSAGLEKFLPYSKKLKTLDIIKSNYKKYRSDPYHIEKKFFRPSFIKGYQSRIHSKNNRNEY